MSAVPKELDETAYVDGYSFGRFFFKIFVPTIAAGIGITMFFCFMISWDAGCTHYGEHGGYGEDVNMVNMAVMVNIVKSAEHCEYGDYGESGE